MAGGLAAEAGGGKFANGAVSAAFAQAFNDWHTEQTNSNQTRLFTMDLLPSFSNITGIPLEPNVINELSVDFPINFLNDIRVHRISTNSSLDGITIYNHIFIREEYYSTTTATGIALLGHEIYHSFDYYNNPVKFLPTYFGEYNNIHYGRLSGNSKYQSYRNISTEYNAFSYESSLNNRLISKGYPK